MPLLEENKAETNGATEQTCGPTSLDLSTAMEFKGVAIKGATSLAPCTVVDIKVPQAMESETVTSFVSQQVQGRHVHVVGMHACAILICTSGSTAHVPNIQEHCCLHQTGLNLCFHCLEQQCSLFVLTLATYY